MRLGWHQRCRRQIQRLVVKSNGQSRRFVPAPPNSHESSKGWLNFPKLIGSDHDVSGTMMEVALTDMTSTNSAHMSRRASCMPPCERRNRRLSKQWMRGTARSNEDIDEVTITDQSEKTMYRTGLVQGFSPEHPLTQQAITNASIYDISDDITKSQQQVKETKPPCAFLAPPSHSVSLSLPQR